MALSIPAGVSTMRGGGLPGRGFTVTVLVTMPPNRATSTSPANSLAYPNVPDATSTGLASRNGPNSTASLVSPVVRSATAVSL